MIHANSLTFNYSGIVGFTYPEIELGVGESLLILGNSGSGKTSLLHLLAGILSPAQGKVLVGPEKSDLHKQPDRFRGENIGIVFQQPYFVKSLNVEQNLQVAQSMAGRKSDLSRVHQLLKQLGLEDRGSSRIGDLSTGELQRVSIARALINKPVVVLADEPTASLDDDNCSRVITLLENVCHDQNTSLIVVTHDNRLSGHFTRSIHL